MPKLGGFEQYLNRLGCSKEGGYCETHKIALGIVTALLVDMITVSVNRRNLVF